nr:nucleotide-binding protein [uncultured Albidiferax sp.]
MTSLLPALFIGSSTEGLGTAYAIQQALEYDAEPTVWSQGLFQPSQSVLSELVKNLSSFKFAAFVFSPDDTVKLRGTEFLSVRDNVIFELGLFMGALGPSRCFYLIPRNTGSLHLPSDLAGINALTYNASRSDGNLLAALGPACNEIRNAIKRQTQAAEATKLSDSLVSKLETASDKLKRYCDIWNGDSLMKARNLLRQNGVPMSAYELADSERAEWEAFQKVFYFLESVSAAILASEIDSATAKQIFGVALPSVWRHASTALSMPNHTEERWHPLPAIAQVSALWTSV